MTYPTQAPPPKRGMPKWLIVLLVILLVIVLGCCGLFTTCYFVVKRNAGISIGALPASFPADVEVPGGFRPIMSAAPPGSDSGTAALQGSTPPSDIADSLDTSLTAKGWTRSNAFDSAGKYRRTYTKDGQTLVIDTERAGGNTNLTVEWHRSR